MLKSVVQVRIELTTPAFPYAISILESISTMRYQLRYWTSGRAFLRPMFL